MYSLGEAQRVLSTWGWERGKGYVHGAKQQRQAGSEGGTHHAAWAVPGSYAKG